MKKKITSLALVLALCLSLLPVTAFAEGENEDSTTTVDTWDGTVDTSWYTEGTEVTSYHIKTAEQLAGLAELINKENASVSFDGKTVYLDSDLDLAGHEWISIGNGLAIQNANQHDPDWYYSFNGTFDGQGHVIYNLYSHDSLLDNEDNFVDGSAVATPHGRDVYKTGLFGQIYEGTVKNLGIANADIWIDPNDVSTYGEGILVDYLDNSTIENCWTTGSITGGSCVEKYIGGLVGTTLNNCTISGCYSSAEIIGNYGTSSNIYSSSDQMTYYDSLGGIVGGPIYGNIIIKDCWFDGKITVNSIQAAVGGIVGASNADIENCLVISEDIEKDPVEDGQNTCWVGYLFSGSVKNCFWPDDNKYSSSTLDDDGQGIATSDFTSASVLEGITTNAGTGITWVAGINHPTFEWDKWHISANYTAVDEALEKIPEDLSRYTTASVDALNQAKDAVDRTKSQVEQADVDAMAKAIEDAIAGLVRRSSSSSSSGNTTTKTETTTNPDGSTTKTETKKDGSVTETTTGTDGSVTKTETKTDTKSDGSKTETKTETKTDADGNKTTSKTETTTDKSGTVTESKTETKTDADGTKTEVKSETKKDQNGVTTGTETVKETLPNGSTGTTTTTTDANGTKTEAVTTISSKAVDEAKKNDEAVTVPVDVKATEDSQTAPTVKVELPKNSGETKVEIPVSNVTPGTVVAVVKPDGTEEIVKDCIPTENGIQLAVEDNVTLKVFDNAKDFTDTKGHWAEPYIDFASARELLNGISEDTFAPEQPTTRAMMWTVLARQDDTDLSGGTTWYDKAQVWAKDSGVSDGTAPQANVTRAQMVTMLWRAAGSPAPQTMSSFADVSADAYYAAAVAWAAEQGITNGVSATQFQPNGACTRAQIAAFLYRASLEN